ncbi:MAG: hypothetical protein LBF12_01650 [Christensenellaceae bacterium]|jgi:hypothetical protein|nr:hypothetical protein [Christensenellaceae bacterium]
MKNKIFVLIAIVFFLLISGLSLASCNEESINDLTNVKWTSVDPEMEVIVLDKREAFGNIVFKGRKIGFYISFTLYAGFALEIKPDEYSPIVGDPDVVVVDVSGGYKYYKNEKKLVLCFNTSDAFGDVFSLVSLTLEEIDPLIIEPKERYDVSWISKEPDIRFVIQRCETEGGRGIVQIENTSGKIFFEWNEGQKFSVYLLDAYGVKQSQSVMEGNYSGSAVAFEIFLTKDELFNGMYQTITFVPDKDIEWYDYVFDE